MRKTLIFLCLLAALGGELAWAGEVARAQFTTAVAEREPVDDVVSLNSATREIHFFTELVGFEGQTVVHRWEFGGRVMAEVPFTVGGPRWRVFSTKKLDPQQLGEWTVVVVDGKGAPLRAALFQYTEGPTMVTPR